MNLKIKRIYVPHNGDVSHQFEVPENWFILDVEWDEEVIIVSLYRHVHE